MRYSSVKNSSSAYKALIFILLKLRYVCWGSPDEHFAVCPTSAGRKTTEIHGVEVGQSSSTIFGHMTAGNVRFLAHLSRRLIGELIVYRSSRRPCVRPSVRPFTFSNMNISATSWLIGMKFYLKHHWGGGKASVGFDPDRI